MENTDEEDDLKLVKASAGLLTELESGLPKLLWKPARADHRPNRRAHTRVRKRDLDRIIQLIEPFQGEPQLLDAKLKSLLPPIVDAYLENLSIPSRITDSGHLDLEDAVCSLLYTLSKVRGYKVVVAFLNNEPRWLEPILEALERTAIAAETKESLWQVPYVLLLWLSHLLLAPFDLDSISMAPGPDIHVGQAIEADIPELPGLTSRILRIGLLYLTSPTKAQDSAASMLVRLAVRPDVQKLKLGDYLVKAQLLVVEETVSSTRNVYEVLGSLRLVAGIVSSAELSHLVPTIYETCMGAINSNNLSTLSSNAVAKKLVVKILRNTALLTLQPSLADETLLDFVQANDVLEGVIDYLLQSLGNKDTPVRYAAAKAISLIVLQLESSMGYEVIQAILDTFKEDMPSTASKLDFSTVDSLKWHGLTLALSHALFKRSAAPEQLTDILGALISALQFQQRTATGSTLGTNVRDAANFGIWSLARRYTTAELLSVSDSSLSKGDVVDDKGSIIESLAIQLILSATMDPAGNIRRGSSAALQELVGRHPDQVPSGIVLVQVVDYQAVSQRARAMVDVAQKAAALHSTYWLAIFDALFGWRCLGSADVPSREAAATSLARLASIPPAKYQSEPERRMAVEFKTRSHLEVEYLHGLILAAALIFAQQAGRTSSRVAEEMNSLMISAASTLDLLRDFSRRKLRSELPVSLAKLITARCNLSIAGSVKTGTVGLLTNEELHAFDEAVDRLLIWHHDHILEVIPDMIRSLHQSTRQSRMNLASIDPKALSHKVAVDGSKSSFHSAGRALALGALVPLFESGGINSEEAFESVATLSGLFSASSVDWRVIAVQALFVAVDGLSEVEQVEDRIVKLVCNSIHLGLNDYTIDERGDVGSLVRLQSINCASRILSTKAFLVHESDVQVLQGDMLRLSLEKLDRVRLKAAQCRKEFLDLGVDVNDVAAVSSFEYFHVALSPLDAESSPLVHKALLEGCISCAGVSAEPLLQASRRALALHLYRLSDEQLQTVLTVLVGITKDMLVEASSNSQAALELLAFLLDMQIPQRLSASTSFKWRNLLSIVQKLHHKSNDIPKILAAVYVYIGLADVVAIRNEVMKKLVGMLRTNPYPRVRSAVAEAIWILTGSEALKDVDWTKPVATNARVVEELQKGILDV